MKKTFYIKSAFIRFIRVFTWPCGRCKGPRPILKVSGEQVYFVDEILEMA